ncbi:hypothetical protein BKA69DRAFT_1122445 [Paraphysoderma sedebokerense]|nr:hypothetical protein BKA69DRAFT_1122445 [Paraphysoderma sedebokerense]
MRREHDSEGQSRHERRKRGFCDPNHTSVSNENGIKASEASKLVAIMQREDRKIAATVNRLHRWNILTPIPLEIINRNTTTIADITAFGNATKAGEICESNPLENGKFVLCVTNKRLYLGKILGLFVYKNGKHCWVRNNPCRKNISYVSLQIYYYSLDSITASPSLLYPNERTFAHIPGYRLLYLFPKSDSESICDMPSGEISLPSIVRRIIIPTFAKDQVLEYYEAQFKRKKKDTNSNGDS